MVIVEARLIWMCSGKGDKGGNERPSKEESVKSQQAVIGKEAWSLEIILSKLFNTDEEIQGQEGACLGVSIWTEEDAYEMQIFLNSPQWHFHDATLSSQTYQVN